MDITKFVEAIQKSDLPFVYSGNKLQDEKCQIVLKKIGGEGAVLGVITGNSLFGLEGLAVTDTGIWFSISSGTLGTMSIPKPKGAFPFNAFILNSVTVKKAILDKFNVEFVMYDLKKSKSFTFTFSLIQDNLNFEESMTGELEGIFKTLVSTTGTEYVEEIKTVDGASPKDPNTFDFVYNETHSIIVLDDKNIVIKKLKIDEKTKIQTLAGSLITIPRSAIVSVTKGKAFSPLTLFKLMGGGIAAWILFWLIINFFVGFILFLLSTIFGFSLSFPTTLIIKRKDGQKFSTRFSGGDKFNAEYERFIKTIFK